MQDHPIPTTLNTILCTAHRATCPATANATARVYPQPSRIYSASILFSNTRCVSAALSESNETSPLNIAENRYGIPLCADGDALAPSPFRTAAVPAMIVARCIREDGLVMLDDGSGWVVAVDASTLEEEELVVPPLPSGAQITRRIGKSFAQLLTRRAVLIAVGLAGNGGGSGWSDCKGAPDGRRDGPEGCEGVGGGMGDVAPDATVPAVVVPEAPVGVGGEE